MSEATKKRNVLIGAIVLLVVLIAAAGIIYATTRPQTDTGDKTITFEVIDADGTSESFTINTNAEYLRGALEEQDLVSGTESEYGLYVLTVNGITADEANREFWSFSKDGQMLNTGVDSTPIADGDKFEATLSTY